MKRSQPLKRRTALKRTAMKRSGSNLVRSRLRAVSDRRRRENAARRKVLREKYGTAPVLCERCKVRWADDPHELLPRAQGGSITDPANIRMVCRICHDEIHANPAESYRDGWLVRSASSGPRAGGGGEGA